MRNFLLSAAMVFLVPLCAALPAQAQDNVIPDLAPEALNSLSTVYVINAMPVFDIHGAPIGRVQGVTPRANGMLWSVTILLEHGRQVNGQPANGAATQTILASDASFDGRRVIADVSAQPRG
jgi:hypothetical protein